MDIRRFEPKFDENTCKFIGMGENKTGAYFVAGDMCPLLEELETLRASDRIKQANIALLREENVRLKTELLCMAHDRDALLEASLTICALRAEIDKYQAEREAKEYQDIDPQSI